MDGTREGAVDIRGHLEVCGSEDIPEADTHARPEINLDGN